LQKELHLNSNGTARLSTCYFQSSMGSIQPIGSLLREWRQRRHLSQLALACDANISARHLSFLETGRSQPSRDMLLLLAERLDIPLRERNSLLVAAGFAPMFPQRPLTDPALEIIRKAIDVVLTGHEPYPAIAVDRHRTLISCNSAVLPLLVGIDPALLCPPMNTLRFTMHPGGLAPRIPNYREWRLHVLAKLGREVDVSGDPVLVELLRELREYPVPDGLVDGKCSRDGDLHSLVLPFQLATDAGVLSFFSTTTVFGTPIEVTLSEIFLECFYPADATTAEALRTMAATREGRLTSSPNFSS
jgi:transcriptional regulator with XRE-family HTH domain